MLRCTWAKEPHLLYGSMVFAAEPDSYQLAQVLKVIQLKRWALSLSLAGAHTHTEFCDYNHLQHFSVLLRQPWHHCILLKCFRSDELLLQTEMSHWQLPEPQMRFAKIEYACIGFLGFITTLTPVSLFIKPKKLWGEFWTSSVTTQHNLMSNPNPNHHTAL